MKPPRIARRTPRAASSVSPGSRTLAGRQATLRGQSPARLNLPRSSRSRTAPSAHCIALPRHTPPRRSTGLPNPELVPAAAPLSDGVSPEVQSTSFTPDSIQAVPEGIPQGWRRVDDGTTPTPEELQRFGPVAILRRNLDLWTLVCSALRIPWKLGGSGLERGLYVPEAYEHITRRHLAEVAAEGRFTQAPPHPPARRNIHWAMLVLFSLVFWFGVVDRWWTNGAGWPASRWIELGALDTWRTLHGEPYRALTALTLHTDVEHLFANILFGSPFFVLLCRRTGVGPAAALTLLAGTLGNLANAFYRQAGHVSLGFSTALFGVVGLYAAIMAADETLHALHYRSVAPRLLFRGIRRALIFLGAGVAVLAMLGADPSAKTDYAAHIFGLLAGILTGLTARLLHTILPAPSRRGEAAWGIGALLAAACAWLWAILPALH